MTLTQLEDVLLFCHAFGLGAAWQNALGIALDLLGFIVLTLAALKAASLATMAGKKAEGANVQSWLAGVAQQNAQDEAGVLTRMGNMIDGQHARTRGRKQAGWHISEMQRLKAEGAVFSLLAFHFETKIAMWGVALVLVGYAFQLAGAAPCPA